MVIAVIPTTRETRDRVARCREAHTVYGSDRTIEEQEAYLLSFWLQYFNAELFHSWQRVIETVKVIDESDHGKCGE